MTWVRVCRIDEIKPGGAIKVALEPPVAVFNVDGELYATDDTCTHEESSLSEGFVTGHVVECIYHLAKFDVRTGKVLTPPARRDLATYPVKVEGEAVFVDVGHAS